jgi:uncharacterized protein (DUF952 family)
VLLYVEADRLRAPLRWEPVAHLDGSVATDQELFPHLYGAVNLDAVLHAAPLPVDDDGRFRWPAGLG